MHEFSPSTPEVNLYGIHYQLEEPLNKFNEFNTEGYVAIADQSVTINVLKNKLEAETLLRKANEEVLKSVKKEL